eukprot:COSAG02_NODE_20573_length_825_cov_0.961433_2_plen_72_part_01
MHRFKQGRANGMYENTYLCCDQVQIRLIQIESMRTGKQRCPMPQHLPQQRKKLCEHRNNNQKRYPGRGDWTR